MSACARMCAHARMLTIRDNRERQDDEKKKKEREIKHDIITHFLPPCWQVIIKM